MRIIIIEDSKNQEASYLKEIKEWYSLNEKPK